MKNIAIFTAALVMFAFCSCSQTQDVLIGQDANAEADNASVASLTDQLREYDARFTTHNGKESMSRQTRVTYSKSDMVKIAIADVKGGLRGSKHGTGGIIVGAAMSSLIQFGKTTIKKFLWPVRREGAATPHIYRSNDVCVYADSIGYYHNELEYAMFNSDRESCNKGSAELVAEADARMMLLSTGYNNDGGMPLSVQLVLASEIDKVRNVDDSLSFSEYCGQLKALNPEDAEYIDFCAEYIYTAVYANLANIDEYTDAVILKVLSSNVGVNDKRKLYEGVQIAYASILYAKNMEFN